MLKFFQPVSGDKMLQLKKEISDLKARIKKNNNPAEVKKLKRKLMEKETHYNILADRNKIH